MPDLTPQEISLVDQIRAGLKDALTKPCTCGECPTHDQIEYMLALSDERLLGLVQRLGAERRMRP